MSHLNIEMHENYEKEHIEDWQYVHLHNMMELIGCTRYVTQGGYSYHLPRATYFFDQGTLNRQTITSMWKSLETTLKRRITIEMTEGPTWGIGLESPEPAPISLSNWHSTSCHLASRFRRPNTLKSTSGFDSWMNAALLSKTP